MAVEDTPGFAFPNILLPRPGIDLSKWAVIACDQFTSEPQYWDGVEKSVGSAPSTYHMMLPEVWLDTPQEAKRIQSSRAVMQQYLNDGLFIPHDGMIYVEREVEGHKRKGLMLCLDLEHYDFSKGSQTLIRATEGTVIERLPPRIRIREGAPLELPHILVLIDDPLRTVIEPVGAHKDSLKCLYDTELMLGSGHLSGWDASDQRIHAQVATALSKLADPAAFRSKYGVGLEKGVLLFAMGDGNHSLATAKSIWESKKQQTGPSAPLGDRIPESLVNHPSRYALVEIENVHDEGLIFEPIHRVLFNVKSDLMQPLKERFGDTAIVRSSPNAAAMIATVHAHRGASQIVGFTNNGSFSTIEFTRPASQLAVGTLQPFLDELLMKGLAGKIDYVHGDEVTCRLGSEPGNAGFILPAMAKGDLFKTVIMDGVLPRKTFSMGHAKEKRFYMECRKII